MERFAKIKNNNPVTKNPRSLLMIYLKQQRKKRKLKNSQNNKKNKQSKSNYNRN